MAVPPPFRRRQDVLLDSVYDMGIALRVTGAPVDRNLIDEGSDKSIARSLALKRAVPAVG